MNTPKDIAPGSFHGEETSIRPIIIPAISRPVRLDYNPREINEFMAFKNQIYTPTHVLYSSCGHDASPGKVFSHVTFIDAEKGNEGCISALIQAGFHAIKLDVQEYIPTKLHDLVILLAPVTPPHDATNHLCAGGYVVCDNYHGTASILNADKTGFALTHIIGTKNKKPFIEENKNGELSQTVPLDSIKNTRQMEYMMMDSNSKRGRSMGMPFARDPSQCNYSMYCFLKK